ncbi:uncharacterized protein TNCV_4982151 [Trichonephila clavipes]|nr:uncharacterized protein TNCV_4982151 [Trichonephila clavipes]
MEICLQQLHRRLFFRIQFAWKVLEPIRATVPPITSVLDNDREFFQQLKIIIPIACTTVVLVLIITVACVVLIRRRNTNPEEPQQERDISKPVDTVPMTVWEKSGRGDTRLSHSREQLYFPAPYATSRISMYSAEADPEAHHQQQQQHHHHEQTHNTWRSEEREHTYDVPFMHRQNIILDEEANGPEGREIGYQIGRHLYLNPGRPRQTSHHKDRHIVRNACIQPTASTAAIQAQVESSLGAPTSSGIIRRHLTEGHLGSWHPLRVLPFTPTHLTPLFGVVLRTRKLDCRGMGPDRL